MERRDLESAARKVTYLRGLLGIPIGMLFVITGLGNLGWDPLVNRWIFGSALLALAVAALGINRHYDEIYGRVRLSRAQRVRYGVTSTVLLGGALIGGPILDFVLEPPISLFATSFALASLAWFAICVGLRAHHVVIWGSLLVIGLLPVWGGFSDPVSVAWLPIGLASMAAGICDHLALARSFGPAGDALMQGSSVGS